jgi:REP element-mobilizing transposase RayT
MSNGTVRKGYHCAWQIHYHIVFPVKYRKALLDSEVTEIIKETSEGIAERYSIEMEAIGCDSDHIHLLCGAHPKIAPGRIVQIFKSCMFSNGFGQIRQEIKRGFQLSYTFFPFFMQGSKHNFVFFLTAMCFF